MGALQQLSDEATKIFQPIEKEVSKTLTDIFQPVEQFVVKNAPAIAGVALSVALPGIGSAIGAQLMAAGVVTSATAATALGTAIASTAAGVAQGKSFEQALEGAVASAVVGNYAPGIANQIRTVVGSPAVANAITSAGASALQVAAAGGNEDAIVKGMTAGLVGSGVTSAYKEAGLAYANQIAPVVGSAAATAATGGNAANVLASAAANYAANSLVNQIPGIETMPAAAKAAATSAIAAELNGKNPNQAALNAALRVGATEAFKYTSDTLGLSPTSAAAAKNVDALQANVNQIATDSPDLIKQLQDAGLQENQNTDWAAIYAQPSTDPVTGQTIVGADQSQYPVQDLGSNTKVGSGASGWQASGSDMIRIQDDGSAMGYNTETGDSYALDANTVKSMIANKQLNTANSGYVAATGGTGNTPGGTPTAPAPAPKTSTTAAPTATTATTTPAPAATTPTAMGYSTTQTSAPAALADIGYLFDPFGESIFAPDKASAEKQDIIKYLQNNVATAAQGGSIDDLLNYVRK